MSPEVTIRLLWLCDEALVEAAAQLFDHKPLPEQTRAFLASDREFMWLALKEGLPVGFVSATSILHPDKPPHLFVNELATHQDHWRRGIATRLMRVVEQFGRENDLWPIWVAAEGDDAQAISFYRSLGDMEERGAPVFEWE